MTSIKSIKKRIKKFFSAIRAFLKKHKKAIRLTILFSVLILITGVFALSILLLNIYNGIEDIEAEATAIAEGSIVYDRNGEELFRFNSVVNREVVGIDRIPENMRAAIIALEDENYYSNPVGIPLYNIAGAAGKCALSRGQNCRGGSGLAQQLIDNATGLQTPTVENKVEELLKAVKLNQEVGDSEEEKEDKVLELYLNWVHFGRNTYGVQAASRTYFGHEVDAKDVDGNYLLNPAKACYLASMVQRPSTFAEGIRLELVNRQSSEVEPVANPAWDILEGRKNTCLQKNFELELTDRGQQKLIQSSQELDQWSDTVVEFLPQQGSQIAYGHLQTFISDEITKLEDPTTGELITENDLFTKGYRITTTFDKNTQDTVQRILAESSETIIKPSGGNNASSMVVDGPTGEVLAMVGSVDFNNEEISGQVNVALAPRQPGSSYKPYVYASAFNNGFNPGTVVIDEVTDFGGGYRPTNFDKTVSGRQTIRNSLQNSLNIPAVRTGFLSQGEGTFPNVNGATNGVKEFAEQAGVEHPFGETCTLTITLGGCEVTLFSHMEGFNTLLHSGTKHDLKPFLEITFTDSNGDQVEVDIDSVYRSTPNRIKPEVAQQITHVLSDYSARSPRVWGDTRFNLQLEGWSGENAVAAKTGTTSDVKDTWTMGGSSQLTVGVWVGNTDGKPMRSDISSVRTAAPIWNRIMTELHASRTPTGFDFSLLTNKNIDPETGLALNDGETGVTEVMSEDQYFRLVQARDRLNSNDYNPFQNSIFENRSSIVKRRLTVSKVTGKLVPEDQIERLPSESLEEVSCFQIVSEFPLSGNWLASGNSYQSRLGDSVEICPTEFVDPDQEANLPEVEVNLEVGEPVPEVILIKASSPITDGEIVYIEFALGGQTIAIAEEESELEIEISSFPLINGIKDVIITVRDNFGQETELVIESIDFDEVEESSSSSSSSSSREPRLPDSFSSSSSSSSSRAIVTPPTSSSSSSSSSSSGQASSSSSSSLDN